MRIAFSGAHRCGKSTLIADLEERLDGYRVIPEPYELMEEDGYEFTHPPSIEDFVEQLRCSLAVLDDEAPNLLLDRCPLDFIAYLLVHEDSSESFDLDEWMEQVRSAVQTLDLIVFVPIEHPDRIPGGEEPALRAEVDAQLQRLLLENPLGLDVEVLTVEGSTRDRVQQVVDRLGRSD
jgi:hypothetical protein